MMRRPQPARWFKMVVVREELPRALAILAARQTVELEWNGLPTPSALVPALTEHLDRFNRLADLYRPYWPVSQGTVENYPVGDPLSLLKEAILALEGWQGAAGETIRLSQEAKARAMDLDLLAEFIVQMGASPLQLAHLRQHDQAEGVLEGRVFVVPQGRVTLELPEGMLTRQLFGKERSFVVAVGSVAAMGALREAVTQAKGRPLHLPDWLSGTALENGATIKKQAQECQDQQQQFQKKLAQIGRQYDLPGHLAAVELVKWFYANLDKISCGEMLSWVSGWTDRTDIGELNHYLEENGVRAVVGFSEPPAGEPPLVLVNPWWVKPFELFPRLMGTPGRFEADPSLLLAFMAPFLFGFMFGDVGQGAVIFGAGWYLRGRFDAAWLMITGGFSAMVFGVLFGSVFCVEGWLPPLWLHPTAHPLLILGIPVALGAGVILMGMSIEGQQAAWRGQWDKWLRREAGIMLLYVGLLLFFLHPLGGFMAGAGVVWFVVGGQRVKPGLLGMVLDVAHLLESGIQLLVNTLSFSRVGAFALAHAGLSQAVITLTDVVGSPWAGLLVVVFGNVLILMLEGLVVSVQTTRLILFEFFSRFLKGQGRSFKPLSGPQACC
ncbi:MAG: hypothetical protein H7832_09665 [Magnetococcus sp. DMHC-6]